MTLYTRRVDPSVLTEESHYTDTHISILYSHCISNKRERKKNILQGWLLQGGVGTGPELCLPPSPPFLSSLPPSLPSLPSDGRTWHVYYALSLTGVLTAPDHHWQVEVARQPQVTREVQVQVTSSSIHREHKHVSSTQELSLCLWIFFF